ncbi:DUF3108 domain-containing protein [Rugamonas sp.]|uniref:DUF3108 domain-containing protein n=1 Tax=Rugamonas sp. TaxID=1926287 RepID=UPI0025CBADB1|nr:DUF3108 domain-containing protein [Rugamonas sp.]
MVYPYLRRAAPLLALAAIVVATSAGAADAEHPSVKHAYSLAPSAELDYSVKTRQHGLSLGGDAVVHWQAGDGKYAIAMESHASLLGKVLENRSEGLVDDYGLAPLTFYEKRFRKDPTTTSFKRDSKTIVFTDGDESYAIKGGEQDRTSAPWQLVAQARATPERFKPGSEWRYFVAGRRDAEAWSFKVVGTETVHTGMGEVSAVHVVKAPPPDAQGQQVDLWLAPSLDWYPVKIRFNDADGDFFEQQLEKITKK